MDIRFDQALGSIKSAGYSPQKQDIDRLRQISERYNANPDVVARLDDEQFLAVFTDGLVVVAAGAGSGKTTTLETRVRLLLAEGVSPARILIITFNTKAAQEIRDRLSRTVGDVATSQLRLGTMHSQFGRWVQKFGTPSERLAITQRLISDRPSRAAPTTRQLAAFMAREWMECREDRPPRDAVNLLQRWMVEGLTPEQASVNALTKAEQQASIWYEWNLGFRGFLGKDWAPPCKSAKGKARWKEFGQRYRPSGSELLGEINDMVLLLDRILIRDERAANQMREEVDHILVDEGQDLNVVQHRILRALRVGLGKPGRSFWLVGDERQSINSFVGASPELFASLPSEPGFVLRTIRTNYRCLPEIVALGNRLMSAQPTQLNIASLPDPLKPVGAAVIGLLRIGTHEEAAARSVAYIAQQIAGGRSASEFAVLTRTNLELAAFEASCIVARVPYAKRGSTSFLDSADIQIVRAYLNVFSASEPELLRASLAKILDKPSRFFLRPGEASRVIDKLTRGSSSGGSVIEDLIATPKAQEKLVEALRGLPSWQEWNAEGVAGELASFARQVVGVRGAVRDGRYETRQLIDEILRIEGAPIKAESARPTLADTILPFGGDSEDGASTADGTDADMPLGNIAFLYMLLESQPTLSKPLVFSKHLAELEQGRNNLRYDPRQWAEQQAALPYERRSSMPAVTLGSVHSVKGLQWVTVVVEMAPNVFPWTGQKEKGFDAEKQALLDDRARQDLLTERQLAYVAVTRATTELLVLAPLRNAYGKGGAESRFISEAGLIESARQLNGSDLPALQELVSRATFEPEVGQAAIVATSEEELLKSFGLGVIQAMTTPKDPKKSPIEVFEVRGNTAPFASMFKKLGGRYFQGAWSFWQDPTSAIASALGESTGSTVAAKAVDQDCPPDDPTCQLGQMGRQCGISTAILVRRGGEQLRIPARYCLVEIEALVPSHVSRAHDVRAGIAALSQRPDYPPGVQERRYEKSQEALKIDRIASDLEPGEIFNQGSSAVSGPPITTAQGWVLGGNGRTLGLDAFYSAPEPAPGVSVAEQKAVNQATLKSFLAGVEGGFGFSVGASAQLRHPGIIRVVRTKAGDRNARFDDLTAEETAELVNLVRVFNAGLTQPIDAASRAVSQARALPARALEYLASGIGQGTLTEYLTSTDSEDFVGELRRQGILDASDPTLFEGRARVSPLGRDQIERLLAASMLPDASLYEKAGADVRRALLLIGPYLLAARAADPAWDLAGLLDSVVRDFLSFRSAGSTMSGYFAQVTMPGSGTESRADPRHIPMLKFLAANVDAPRKLSTAARGYYAAAVESKAPQQGLFSATRESEREAFKRIFGTEK